MNFEEPINMTKNQIKDELRDIKHTKYELEKNNGQLLNLDNNLYRDISSLQNKMSDTLDKYLLDQLTQQEFLVELEPKKMKYKEVKEKQTTLDASNNSQKMKKEINSLIDRRYLLTVELESKMTPQRLLKELDSKTETELLEEIEYLLLWNQSFDKLYLEKIPCSALIEFDCDLVNQYMMLNYSTSLCEKYSELCSIAWKYYTKLYEIDSCNKMYLRKLNKIYCILNGTVIPRNDKLQMGDFLREHNLPSPFR